MKKILDCIIRALLMFWELPQNILGALLFIFFAVFSDSVILDDDDSLEIYSPMMRGAISLGIFRVYAYKYLGNGARYVELVRKHEKEGHRKQSKMLGPLYLIVIGIPSLIWATLHSYVKRLGAVDYYSFYTEKWADRLAGVKR